MLNSIKNMLKKLPGINRLVADRDRLRVQLDDAAWQRDNLLSERNSLQLELDEVTWQRDELNTQRQQTNTELEELKRNQGFVPAGHFYSPIPCFDEIKKDAQRIFGDSPQTVMGVELNETEQLQLLNKLIGYYKDMPFQAEKQEGLRYYYEHTAFSCSDAILLHCMIRDLKPRKVIEVGSIWIRKG